MSKMTLYDNREYIEDINRVADLPLPWDKLEGSTVLLSGARGMIGSFLTDVLMMKRKQGLGLCVCAIGRSEEALKERFSFWDGDAGLSYAVCDITKKPDPEITKKADFVLHLASNTHPLQYSTDPIGTITTNINGLLNMLELAAQKEAKRVLFASSNEIYGENRKDTELFDEEYCGYIDCNTLRAGYPESKRCGEALCQAYISAKKMDIVIPRLTRSYGPTMLMSDTKAISQFIRKALADEDIVLKSAGTQTYSYTYTADAVSGLLTVLLKGECGRAYNIADERSDISLKDLAGLIAGAVKRRVVFEVPDEVEAAGYSKATKARLDGSRIKEELGWEPAYDIKSGIERTVRILKER